MACSERDLIVTRQGDRSEVARITCRWALSCQSPRTQVALLGAKSFMVSKFDTLTLCSPLVLSVRMFLEGEDLSLNSQGTGAIGLLICSCF